MSQRKSSIAARNTTSRPASMFQKSQDEETIEPVAKPPRVKKTFYVGNDVVLLLGELQLEQLRSTGKKPDLSDLVEEGVRMLAQSRQDSGTKQASNT